MSGYSLADMADITGLNYDSVELRFRNAVYHIVKQNDLEWAQKYGNYRQDGA
ncbi:MAG: hypothetical protein IKE17_03235 [Clostridia bacterium]|nr:hypothetical protein [Clostridia bacterium]